MKHVFLPYLFVLALMFATSCDDDEGSYVTSVSVNGNVLFDDGDDFFGDVNGDFASDGGNATRTFLWENSLGTADYNADITTLAEGSFQMIVKDADGNVVLDKSLNGAVEPDSFSGVTSSGTPGIWSVTIVLTSFNGDGSFSLSEGD